MKLHGPTASPYVARVVMCARAKGLHLDHASGPSGGLASAEYPELGALGKTPIFEVDGQTLTDAEVICEYLEDAYTKRSLRPTDLLERATARHVARMFDSRVLAQLGPLYRHLRAATRDAAQAETAVNAFGRALLELDRCLGRGPYAAGSTLTIADCALLPGMALINLLFAPALGLKNPTDTLPQLREWWAQMGEDPLCVLVLEEWTTAYQEWRRTA